MKLRASGSKPIVCRRWRVRWPPGVAGASAGDAAGAGERPYRAARSPGAGRATGGRGPAAEGLAIAEQCRIRCCGKLAALYVTFQAEQRLNNGWRMDMKKWWLMASLLLVASAGGQGNDVQVRDGQLRNARRFWHSEATWPMATV